MPNLDATQKLSKRVFNAQNRLTVARTLRELGDKMADHVRISEASGVSRSATHVELQFFAEIGAVQRVEASGLVTYLLLPGPFWDWVDQLLSFVEPVDRPEVTSIGGHAP